MSSRPRDRQLRCPYCNRHLGRSRGDYLPQKFCPSCGSTLPNEHKPRFDGMMRGADFARRACPLEVIAMIAATMFLQ